MAADTADVFRNAYRIAGHSRPIEGLCEQDPFAKKEDEVAALGAGVDATRIGCDQPIATLFTRFRIEQADEDAALVARSRRAVIEEPAAIRQEDRLGVLNLAACAVESG